MRIVERGISLARTPTCLCQCGRLPADLHPRRVYNLCMSLDIGINSAKRSHQLTNRSVVGRSFRFTAIIAN